MKQKKCNVVLSNLNQFTLESPYCMFIYFQHVLKNISKKFECIFNFSFHIFKAFLNRCEKGWVPFGRNCYKFSSSTATFKDAMVR